MKKLSVFFALFLYLFISCNGTEFVYFMEGELVKKQVFSIPNNHVLDYNISISLQDSDDMDVYAFQLEDLESYQVTLTVTKNEYVRLGSSKLIIGQNEIPLANINDNVEIIITDVSFLKAISESILKDEIADIKLSSNVINGAETNTIGVKLEIKIKGTFIGGH